MKLKGWFFSIYLFLILSNEANGVVTNFYYESFKLPRKEDFLSKEELLWLDKHPVIKIAPDPYFAPFEFLDEEGNYQGIGADYLKAVEEILGVKFEILIYSNWSDIISDFKEGKIDLLNTVFSNAERTSYMLFPQPYLKIPTVVVGRKNEFNRFEEKMLGKFKITMVRDYGLTGMFIEKYPGYKIIFAKTISEALDFLMTKKADIFINDIATTDWYIRKNAITTLEIISTFNPPSYLGFAVRKDWALFKSILDKTRKKIPEALYNNILNRWVKVTVSQKQIFSKLVLYLYIVISAISFFLLVVLIANFRLNQLVERKTQELKSELEKSQSLQIKLKYEREFFNNILNEMPLPLIIVSKNGTVEKINHSFIDFTGYDITYFVDIHKIADKILKRKQEKRKFLEIWENEDENRNEFYFNSFLLDCGIKGNRICNISIKFLQGVFIVIFVDLTEIIKLQKELEKLLKEKELLIREVHHRVKNNFNTVISLLNLQKSKTQNRELKDSLSVAQNRIYSMALIHEMLYQTTWFTEVQISQYIERLLRYLQGLYSDVFQRVEFDIRVNNNITLPMDVAIYCGMIINEILMNSFKYAFPDERGGVVRIYISREKKDLKMEIGDNGIGLPPEENILEKETLGITLIKSLVHQLKGKLECQNKNGLSYFIRLPVY